MRGVETLEAALPSMTQWRAPERRSVDWAALDADLGTALPADFRSLAEVYPVLAVDDFLLVSLPLPGARRHGRPGAGTNPRSSRICTTWATPRLRALP